MSKPETPIIAFSELTFVEMLIEINWKAKHGFHVFDKNNVKNKLEKAFSEIDKKNHHFTLIGKIIELEIKSEYFF
jgi:hypothetical protein